MTLYEYNRFDSGVQGMAGWIVLSLFGLLGVCGVSADADYYIGAGRYDITGPAAEVEMVRDTFAREQWVGLSRSFLFSLFIFELCAHVEDTLHNI